jgi:hypothetical protein
LPVRPIADSFFLRLNPGQYGRLRFHWGECFRFGGLFEELDGGGFGGFCFGGFCFGDLYVFSVEVFEQFADDALALGGWSHLGLGGEGTQSGVDDDLLYQGVLLGEFGVAAGEAGQVEAGDLQAVEQQAGSFGIDLVGGDAAQDFADRALDGAAVLGEWEVEMSLVGAALMGVFHGTPGGVVVVAKFFAAEAWAAATAAVGEDVAALEAFGFVLHVCTPLCTWKS